MKKFLCLVAMILIILSAECDAARRFIIDTDTAGDDAAALILAAKTPDIIIEGVTVVAGNVDLEQGTRNALMSLEIAGANIPVYKGADASLMARKFELYSVFGKDGMGDADLIHPKGKAQKKSAVDFILETVKKYPDEVEIITIGPVTNIALAIEKDPATMRRVKRIWSMGTAGFGPGNATPVAEFNVFKDAEAYKVMLDSGVPVTVIGLDLATAGTLIDAETLNAMKNSKSTEKFLAEACGKYLAFRRDLLHEPNVALFDAVAMAAALWDDFVLETETCHASCITAEGETHGQVIFYRQNITYDTMITFDNYNVEVVTKLKADDFVPRYRAAI